VQGTSVASTSGTSVTFTGIPSWVKRITFILNGVSTNALSTLIIQLGTSGGIVTTGYNSSHAVISTAGVAASAAFVTAGFTLGTAAATDAFSGTYFISSFGGNIWTNSGTASRVGTAATLYSGSVPFSLGGVLTQIRLSTVAGDTFDAGSVNILYA
jgi:hypothetical protein